MLQSPNKGRKKKARKAMATYTKPLQRKKEESEKLRGERDQIKFIGLRLERWQVVGLSYVEETPWWPTQSPNNERKKKVKG